jgi:hypothetical protein
MQIAIGKTNQAGLHAITKADSNDDDHAGFAMRASSIRFLDAIVARANTLTVFGVLYKPYWIMCDVAASLAFVYAWAFSRRFPNVSGAVLALAILIALLIYKFVLEVKAAQRTLRSRLSNGAMLFIFPISSHSFLPHNKVW